MKSKYIVIGIVILVLLILITGCTQQVEETMPEPVEETPIEEPAEIFCPDYDGNKEECLLHTECKWSEFRNECYSIDGGGEDEEVEEEDEDEGDEEKMVFSSELEKDLPDTTSNEICKKLPLTEGLTQEEILTLTPGNRQECLAVVNNNPEFCELIEIDTGEYMLGEDDRNVCLAHAKKDVSYCKKMSDDGDKKHCYFGLSLISGDIDVCGGIDYDENEKNLCYWSFANALYWEDRSDKITTEHCNKLPAGSEDRDTCLAFKERDVSLCKNDVNCLTLFEQPMSFCESEGKDDEYCIRNRAMTSKDLSICETLTGALRDDCIGDFVGHISLDVSNCDKITSYFARNTCYKDVAIQSGTNFLFNLYN
jgi:hypothetical protein